MATINQMISTATRAMGDAHQAASGVGYYAYVPYYDAEPHGPSTEIRSVSRSGILSMLRARKAAMVLALAAEEFDIRGSAWDDDVEQLTYRVEDCPLRDRYGVADWRKDVRALIRKYRNA